MGYVLITANRNYSSWSLRPWVLMQALGIPFADRLEPFTKPLVGNIEERHQLAVRQRRRDDIPLRSRERRACRVVAARLQHDDVACLRSTERGLHLIELQRLHLHIEAVIGFHLET